MTGLAPPNTGAYASPLTYSAAGNNAAMQSLNNALNANGQAYTGLQNQAQQQYQQNAGAVQQNLANTGLGNTTVAQTMQQAPLQTLNNALLNIGGQQQGQAANIYGQQANVQSAGGNALAQLMLAMQGQNIQDQQVGNQYAEATATPNVKQFGI
jgi:hypothetical protein